MQPTKLRFFARGNAMCSDLDANEANVRKFIGRAVDRSIGFAGKDENGNVVMSGGHPPATSPSEVSNRAEHRQHCKDGDLWPADEETAAACGVKFDPAFGGEFEAAKTPSLPPHEDITDVQPK